MTPYIRLDITTPCTENWDKMAPETQGRFCASCRKTVVDFTAMDDDELLRWFTTRQEPACGRLRQDQLNRALIPPPQPRKFYWRFWSYLIAGALFSTEAAAQTKPAALPTSRHISIRPDNPHSSQMMGLPVFNTNEPPELVRGKLFDSIGHPVSATPEKVTVLGKVVAVAARKPKKRTALVDTVKPAVKQTFEAAPPANPPSEFRH